MFRCPSFALPLVMFCCSLKKSVDFFLLVAFISAARLIACLLTPVCREQVLHRPDGLPWVIATGCLLLPTYGLRRMDLLPCRSHWSPLCRLRAPLSTPLPSLRPRPLPRLNWRPSRRPACSATTPPSAAAATCSAA